MAVPAPYVAIAAQRRDLISLTPADANESVGALLIGVSITSSAVDRPVATRYGPCTTGRVSADSFEGIEE
jgi:hypothetical protein